MASWLIQAGSFAIVLGLGVIVISLFYGSRTLLVGLALLLAGYVAIGFPGWYFARWRHYKDRLRRLRSRFNQAIH